MRVILFSSRSDMKNLGSSCTTGPTKPGTASLRSSLVVVLAKWSSSSSSSSCSSSKAQEEEKQQQQQHQIVEECPRSKSSRGIRYKQQKQEKQGRRAGGQPRQRKQQRPSVRQCALAWADETRSSRPERAPPRGQHSTSIGSDIPPSERHSPNC